MEKLAKPLIPILLIALLALAWFSAANSFVQTHFDRASQAQAAEQDVEDGLYALAISEYKESLAYGSKTDVYHRIYDIYNMYYEEEHTSEVRESYLDDMVEAAHACPKETLFWETACNLCVEDEEYRQAHDLVHEALNRGTSSDSLDGLARMLDNMTRLGSHSYSSLRTDLHGYMSAADGEEWSILDGTGKTLRDSFKLAGIPNEDGTVMCVNDIDARLIDKKGIVLRRFDIKIDDVGCYDDETHLVPVKTGEKWQYLNTESGEIGKDAYEQAGAYRDGKAAVCEDGAWYLINTNAEHESEPFEDIKLDVGGFWSNDGVVVAKKAGAYRLLDSQLNPKSDFSCSDADACMGKGAIAFASAEGKWGFVDHNGNVMIDPQFAGAKSFSNGRAAIANEDDLWGFADEEGYVVDEYQYTEAYYFNSDNKAYVFTANDSFQLLGLMFD